jgi:glycosyltransferase involved in cell wall biosynthesis
VVETNFQGFVKSRADVRIVPSKALREKMPSSLDIRIIPNPILPPATSTTLRDELGLKDKFVYGRVGRAESDVYSPINLRAYKQVENSSTCFLYVSPNRAARQEVASLGIKNIIFLNATLDEVELSKIYNTCDVVCHSNALGETFGNTIAEAMMHGKPVISHRGSPQYSQAQSELLGDLSARLFVGLDVGAYARAMRDLQNDEVRLEASRYVRERAQSLFDYQTVAREYARLYRSLLK